MKNEKALKDLKRWIHHVPHSPYSHHSRIHPLNSFSQGSYVKREDELGFGISGSKLRKYRTLIPYLKEKKVEEVMVIGGTFSNNVLGACQLLIENHIRPFLFLRGRPEKMGNALLTRLFVPQERIQWLNAQTWPEVEKIASEQVTKQEQLGIRSTLLPEGANCSAALPGLLTLPLDICRNEQKMSISFDHILLEAGTGMTAAALILGLTWLQHPAQVHVLLLAGSISEFTTQLTHFQKQMVSLTEKQIDLKNRFTLYHPRKGKSFGSIHPKLFGEIHRLAQEEGILSDPIYSAKLFHEARFLTKSLTGNILIIHGGGGLGLLGFQPQLYSLLFK